MNMNIIKGMPAFKGSTSLPQRFVAIRSGEVLDERVVQSKLLRRHVRLFQGGIGTNLYKRHPVSQQNQEATPAALRASLNGLNTRFLTPPTPSSHVRPTGGRKLVQFAICNLFGTTLSTSLFASLWWHRSKGRHELKGHRNDELHCREIHFSSISANTVNKPHWVEAITKTITKK